MDIRQGFLVGLILVALALAALLLAPFFGYIIAAGILGYLLHPVQTWLAARIGDTAAAAVIVLLTVVVVIVPLLGASVLVVDDAQRFIQTVRGGDRQALNAAGQWLEQLTGQDIRLRQQLADAFRSMGGAVVGNAASVIQRAAKLSLGLSILLFLEFYALRDGERFVSWLESFEILPADMQRELIDDTGDMIGAVVRGHILVAIIQALVAGIGLFVTGIPNAAFWTFVMILTSLIPILGAIVVWGPAAIYLLATGAPVKGTALLVYGLVVVGFMDNFLRPILVEEDMRLHEAIILIGIVGGIFVFGPIGIFIGPIILGLLNVLLIFFRDHYDRL